MSGGRSDPILILTGLTRRGDQDRRVVVQGFDIPLKNFIIGLIGAVPGLLITGILWPIFDSWSITGVLIGEGVTYWFALSRSRAGVAKHREFLDRRSASVGRAFIGDRPIRFEETRTPQIQLTAAIPVDAGWGLDSDTPEAQQRDEVDELLFDKLS